MPCPSLPCPSSLPLPLPLLLPLSSSPSSPGARGRPGRAAAAPSCRCCRCLLPAAGAAVALRLLIPRPDRPWRGGREIGGGQREERGEEGARCPLLLLLHPQPHQPRPAPRPRAASPGPRPPAAGTGDQRAPSSAPRLRGWCGGLGVVVFFFFEWVQRGGQVGWGGRERKKTETGA